MAFASDFAAQAMAANAIVPAFAQRVAFECSCSFLAGFHLLCELHALELSMGQNHDRHRVRVWCEEHPRTFQSWRALYQDALTKYMTKHQSMILGKSLGDVVVFDETHMGSQRGISKSSATESVNSRSKPIVAMKVLERLPARALHKRPAMRRPASASSSCPAARPLLRPASVMKTVFNENKRGTDKDARSAGRWLFDAVLVGHKSEKYIHENSKKRFSVAILPKPALAPDEKSRGKASMKQAILSCISKKGFVVHDSWKASTTAIADLGFSAAPPVNHSVGWRDTNTGFHSNDIESEFSRLKNMVRERHGLSRPRPPILTPKPLMPATSMNTPFV